MALPAWPAEVPYAPEPNYWGVVPSRQILATDMENGNTRNRRRPGDNVATVTWGRELNAPQTAAFRTFFETTTFLGAARFTMLVCLDAATYETRVVQFVAGSVKIATPGATVATTTFSLLVFSAAVMS